MSQGSPGRRRRGQRVASPLAGLLVLLLAGCQPEPSTPSFCGSEHERLVTEKVRAYLYEHMDVRPGDVVIEIGAGTGLLTAHAARAAGPGGKVIATDINPAQIQRLEAIRGSLQGTVPAPAPIEIRLVAAPRDTGIDDLPSGSADLVLLVNAFGFSPGEIDAAGPRRGYRSEDLAYLSRVAGTLRPHGRLLTHLDWLGPEILRPHEMIPLFAAAGFEPNPRALPLPAEMPEKVLCRLRDSSVELTRGYILEFRRALPNP